MFRNAARNYLLPVAGFTALIWSGQIASGETFTKGAFTFVKVAETSGGGFTHFGSMPAINDRGAVAFIATSTGVPLGAVFRADNNTLTTIASSSDQVLNNFGESVVINSAGVVALSARVVSSNDAILATGGGGPLKTIVSAAQQGLVGGAFLGVSAMSSAGTVIFVAFRKGFTSQAIFAGNGGPLATLIDTRVNTNFASFGNADIDAAGKIVFGGTFPDQTNGIFTGRSGATDIADTNHPNFDSFLDPVINKAGTVASAALFTSGGGEVFTSNGSGIIPRTNGASAFFTHLDNVSINNSADVAFFGGESTGGQGIFLEATGGAAPVPVIETGDTLFGSNVTDLALGRFSLNDRDEISFRYVLADGRSGIAIANLRDERYR